MKYICDDLLFMLTGKSASAVQQNANRQVTTAITWTHLRVRCIPKHWSMATDRWFCWHCTKGRLCIII